MQGVNATALRVALALPLAYGVYRLVVPLPHRWTPGTYLLFAVGVALPALIFAAACLFVLLGCSRRWLWLGLAASGIWMVLIERGVRVTSTWRPSAGFVIGLYAVLLALAFLLGPSPTSDRVPSRRHRSAEG